MVALKGMWYDYQEIANYYYNIINKIIDDYINYCEKDEEVDYPLFGNHDSLRHNTYYKMSLEIYDTIIDELNTLNHLKELCTDNNINYDGSFNLYCINVLYYVHKKIKKTIISMNQEEYYFIFYQKYDHIIVKLYKEYTNECIKAFSVFNNKQARLNWIKNTKENLHLSKSLLTNCDDLTDDERLSNHREVLNIIASLDKLK